MFSSVSIRFHILTNFLVVIGLISAFLLGLQYYFSQDLAALATEKSFTQTAKKITEHIQTGDKNVKSKLYLTELYPDLLHKVTNPKHKDTVKRFSLNMKHAPNIYAMYIGYSNGDLLQVINMKSSSILHEHFKASIKTQWVVVKVYGKKDAKVRMYEYLDKDLNLLSSHIEKTDYLATKRPWFITASQTKDAIRTDPYLFAHLKQKGITFSKVIQGSDAVLSIDFTLNELSDVLKSQMIDPSSEVMMIDKEGTLIASSRGIQANYKLDKSLMKAIKKGETQKLLSYAENGVKKFAMVFVLSKELNSDTYLAVNVDVSAMLAPYLEKISYSIVVAVIFLVLTIPIILFMTTLIVKPIESLMVQNDRIKNRKFDKVHKIDSNIIELANLSDSLASMAGSIQEYQKSQAELMDAFIKLIADAIDAKSHYTGGHCQRVPEIATMLAKVAHDADNGVFKSFALKDEDAWREFQIGAWLHDCGKVTTPEYVVDKATKLETIYNRVHEIRTRFEVVWRDIEIQGYERLLNGEDKYAVEAWKKEEHESLKDDFSFIAECNIGGEFMSTEKQERIKKIAKQTWIRNFDNRAGLSDVELLRFEGVKATSTPVQEDLLSDRPEHIVNRDHFNQEEYQDKGFTLEVPEHLYDYGEIYNLCIEKGTLTKEERFKIQEHVIMTIKMLENLPYPDTLKRIPEYAGTHHETMIGTGYPRGLKKEDLSIPARIMALADIFEALTASDRPYKKGKTLSEALRIMSFMSKDEHIDADIFELFLTSGIYLDYGKEYLKPEQIDEVDITKYL